MKAKTINPRENKRFGIQFSYILDCINSEDHVLTTDKEKIDFFFQCYEKEFNHEWNKRYYPNESERIGQYLQGLPSCCVVEYWCDEIAKIGKSWGFCQTPRKEEKFVTDWWKVLGFRLIQLREIFNK